MYSLALSFLGFRPCAVSNAEDAFARACDMHPDAVIADVTLPGASGLDLTRRLRADIRTKDAGIYRPRHRWAFSDTAKLKYTPND